MRTQVLVGLFGFLVVMGILGFSPIHLQVNDKLLHFSIFFILSFFLYFLWDMSIKRNMLLATVSFLVFAIGSELIQGTLPYRTFDAFDILANLTGGTLGIPLSCLIDHYSKNEYQRMTDEMMMDTVY